MRGYTERNHSARKMTFLISVKSEKETFICVSSQLSEPSAQKQEPQLVTLTIHKDQPSFFHSLNWNQHTRSKCSPVSPADPRKINLLIMNPVS